MKKWRVIRKYVEHYEHIVYAETEYDAGEAAMGQAIQGETGRHMIEAGDSYPEAAYEIKEKNECHS